MGRIRLTFVSVCAVSTGHEKTAILAFSTLVFVLSTVLLNTIPCRTLELRTPEP